MTNPTSLKALAEGRTDLYRVDPRQIHIKPGLNCREKSFDPLDPDDLALALSIKEIGVKVPLELFWDDNKAWVSDGHRRLLAAKYGIEHLDSEIKTVPAQTVDRYSNEADRILSQIIRNSGKPLTSMEQAKVYKKLLDLGWLSKDIATKVGVSPARISQVLDLLAMPEPVKQMVAAGTVSPSLAAQTVKAAAGDNAKAIQVLSNAVTAAQADGRTKAKPTDMSEPPKKRFETIVKDAFYNSDIDDAEDGVVRINMPEEDYMILRDLMKL